MNFAIGLLITVGCILGGYAALGGHLEVLAQPYEFVIIAGSSLGMAAVGLAFIGLAILTLTAAAGYHLGPASDPDDAPAPNVATRRAPESYDGDEDDSDGEPGFGLVSLGALIHCALMLRSGMRRLFVGSAKTPASLAPTARLTPPTLPRWLSPANASRAPRV